MSAPKKEAIRGHAWMVEAEYYDHYAMTDRTFTVRRVFRTRGAAERFVKENPEAVLEVKTPNIHFVKVWVE